MLNLHRTFPFLALFVPFSLACSQAPQPEPPVASSVPHAQSQAESTREVRPAPNPQEIQAVVRLKNDEIRQCYVMGTFRDSQLSGTVHVLFTIETNGRVSATTDGGSNMPDPKVVECVLGVFAKLEFPAGKYDPTQVEYPIRFGKT